MRGSRWLSLAAWAALGSVLGANDAAADCKLVRIGSADMATVDGDSRAYIPAMYGDQQRLLLIDSGSPQATVEPEVVETLRLIKTEIPEGILYKGSGRMFRWFVRLPSLTIGGLHFEDARAFVDPDPGRDSKFGGSLGADLLLRTDVEFDFAQRKINFFSQDHCPGRVIYWQASAAAAIPMQIMRAGYPVISVTLDGHPVDAIIDTGSTDTFLDAERGRNIFGTAPGTPDVSLVSGSGADDPHAVYKHTFKSLDLAGVAIGNIPVLMTRNLGAEKIRQQVSTGTRLLETDERNGAAPLTLGMRELRKLHLFFDYKEKMLYVTPAETKSAPAH